MELVFYQQCFYEIRLLLLSFPWSFDKICIFFKIIWWNFFFAILWWKFQSFLLLIGKNHIFRGSLIKIMSLNQSLHENFLSSTLWQFLRLLTKIWFFCDSFKKFKFFFMNLLWNEFFLLRFFDEIHLFSVVFWQNFASFPWSVDVIFVFFVVFWKNSHLLQGILTKIYIFPSSGEISIFSAVLMEFAYFQWCVHVIRPHVINDLLYKKHDLLYSMIFYTKLAFFVKFWQ